MLKTLKSVAGKMGLRRRRLGYEEGTTKFADQVAKRGDDPFSKLFYGYDGDRMIHKWHHYLPIYSRLFERFRARKTPVRFLEIGVYLGGSLEMWRSYFGPDAVIFGIDIDPRCAAFNDAKTQVRIGSQDDPQFLASVVREMGGVDIVLDDGSHVAKHVRASFDALFPLLENDGLYVVEDLQTSYWSGVFQGGYRRAGTFVEFSKSLIDGIHWRYNGKPKHPAASEISCIQMFDSIVAFEKNKNIEKPFDVRIGKGIAGLAKG